MRNRCNCTYETLVKRGFSPIDHAWTCTLNKDYVENSPEIEYFKVDKKKDVLAKGNNPYNEVGNKDLGFDYFRNREDELIFKKKWNK